MTELEPENVAPVEEQSSEPPAFTGVQMRKRDPIARREEVRRYVVEEGYAPVSAEQVYFEEHRLTFWTVSDEEDRLALLKPSYPWHVAVAWIASQTTQGAAEGIAAFRVWQGRVWRDPVRPRQIRAFRAAEAMLLSALCDGRVIARFMGPNGIEVVPREEWEFLKWKADATGEVLEFEQLLWGDVPRYGPVSISREEIRAVFKPLDEPQAATIDAPATDTAPEAAAVPSNTKTALLGAPIDLDPADYRILSDPDAEAPADQVDTPATQSAEIASTAADEVDGAEIEPATPAIDNSRASIDEIRRWIDALDVECFERGEPRKPRPDVHSHLCRTYGQYRVGSDAYESRFREAFGFRKANAVRGTDKNKRSVKKPVIGL